MGIRLFKSLSYINCSMYFDEGFDSHEIYLGIFPLQNFCVGSTAHSASTYSLYTRTAVV